MSRIASNRLELLFSQRLYRHLGGLLQTTRMPLWLSGGTIRDLLIGREPADIDLTVPCDAQEFARRLADECSGTLVPLGRGEDASRVVVAGTVVDIASFREGAGSIEEDLAKRDLSINAMAVRIDDLLSGACSPNRGSLPVIDPTGGGLDLGRRVIRMAGQGAFASDPLRMVRVFRFGATLGFTIDEATLAQVTRERTKVTRVAAERVRHELDLLFAAPEAWPMAAAMAETGLLLTLLPELAEGVGMEQPASHHLDVFAHNLETLRQTDGLLNASQSSLLAKCPGFAGWVAEMDNRRLLRWAALLHDVGKPCVRSFDGDRITFHDHDQQGAVLFEAIARRLRWSKDDSRRVARLIGAHMRPFHLANVARRDTVSFKACLRLIRAIDTDLPGLFLLALADALAGKGQEKPPAMEDEIVDLYRKIEAIYREQVVPTRSGPPLLSGQDLIDHFGLAPGPRFRVLLAGIEEEQIEGTIRNREEALAAIRRMLAEEKGERSQ